MLALTLLLAVAGADPADVPAPPPLLGAPAPTPSDPAAEASGAVPTTPTTTPTTTPPTPPTTAAPPTSLAKPGARLAPKADARAVFVPLDPLVVAVLQGLVPCGVAVIGVPCSLFIPGGLCITCLLPAASGYLSTYLGDKLGPSRAPVLWPVLLSYVAALAGVITGAAVYLAFATPGNVAIDQSFYAIGAGGLAIAALAVVAVPIAYAATSEPKHAGDDGSTEPGWLAPGHPPARMAY